LAEVEVRQLIGSPEPRPRQYGDTHIRFADENGAFGVQVPPGSYVIGAGSPRVWWPDAATPELAEAIRLAPGAAVTNLEIGVSTQPSPLATPVPVATLGLPVGGSGVGIR
jgi:hypothetical protein